jgi:hypothetical protein
MKSTYVLIAFLFSSVLYGQTENLFLNLQYDSLLIYDFESRAKSEHYSIIDEKGKLVSSVKKSVRLETAPARQLSTLLGKKTSYGQATAACFEPHLGILYYRQGRPVAHITICMDCNRLVSGIRIPAQEQGKQGEGAETYYIADGMSKSMRKHLNGLLKKYAFSHQLKPGSMFD